MYQRAALGFDRGWKVVCLARKLERSVKHNVSGLVHDPFALFCVLQAEQTACNWQA